MKNVIIFGDSYSTFEGELPEKHTFYYPKMDVTKKEDTWWWQFFKRSGYKLIYNDSWSGSTIGYTGYNNYDCSKTSSFICRYKKLKNDGYFNNKDVDLIIVFGGSNDSWSDAPLGEMMFSDWKEEDLYKVLPAISYFLSSLRNDFPNSEILFVINNGIKNEMKDSIITYSKFYGFKYVELHDIEKINDHPTKNGMNAICNQILSEVQIMKNVLIITTSLRNGSNSDILAEYFKKGAESSENKVEVVSLKNKKISFCRGCFACQKIGHCVIDDDANEITDKIANADVVVWATPIYYYEMSGQMKTMIDRANSLFSRERNFKDVYILASADDNNPSTINNAKSGIEGWIKCMKGSRLAGSVFVGGIEEERAIIGNEGLDKAFELGKNV